MDFVVVWVVEEVMVARGLSVDGGYAWQEDEFEIMYLHLFVS